MEEQCDTNQRSRTCEGQVPPGAEGDLIAEGNGRLGRMLAHRGTHQSQPCHKALRGDRAQQTKIVEKIRVALESGWSYPSDSW